MSEKLTKEHQEDDWDYLQEMLDEQEAQEEREIQCALRCKCGAYKFTPTNKVARFGDCVCNY